MSDDDIQAAESELNINLFFPYYLGPTVRHATTGLLWSGELYVAVPGWPHDDPIDAWLQVGGRASERAHPLASLFVWSAHHFELAQKQCIRHKETLRPLQKWIRTAITVHPATEEHYAWWEPLHQRLWPMVEKSFADPQMANCASVDFIFRVYELWLQLDGDLDKILESLLRRAKRLGKPEMLLVEGLLNRYTMPRSGKGTYCTPSVDAVAILAALGTGIRDADTATVRSEQLALLLFQELAQPFAPPLAGESIGGIGQLLSERSSELEAFRRRCREESRNLVGNAPSGDGVAAVVSDRIVALSEEANSIASLSKKGFSELLGSVLSNQAFWVATAGLMGSLTVAAPPVVPATLAITAFSVLGAEAVKNSLATDKSLRTSSFRFLYQLQHLKDRAGRGS